MDCIEFSKKYKQSYAMKESLRALKTNIRFCGDDIKVILITSSMPGEGKSFVSMNLAISLSESGNRVLMIDTDMRNSVILSRFGVKATAANRSVCGLSHYLSGQKTMEEVIYQTDVENLSVVFAGPPVPNPTEILEKEYFTTLISVARKVFDYVIIDTAPISLTIDSAVVAKHADGIILVTAPNGVNTKLLTGAVRQLQLTGTPILGAVLNKYVEPKHSYGSYGAYGVYGSYGSYGENKKK